VTPPERDQLKQALGDKITIQETPWLCKLDLFFNAKVKPFDDPRVRRALQISIDRWGGATPLSKIAIVGPVGSMLRPGSELALAPAELEKLPGYSRNMEAARAEAKKLLEEAGVKDLKIKLLNRNTNMPFTPVGVFIVDQWRRIGVTTDHQQLDVSIQKKNTQSGEFEAALDAFCMDSDDPRPKLLPYLSRSKSPRNVAHNESPEVDRLFDQLKAAQDAAERKRLAGAIQTAVINEGYSVPVIWYSRIVAHSSAMKGWKAVPTHFVNQDLGNVWLDQ
jgi:peptide/nickel transport system substrate-binding protein